MFAEGATSNGTHLLKFRRGAFVGEKRVTPMYLKYPIHGFSTDYGVMDFLPLLLLNLSWFGLKCHINIMPDFEPNDYLFKKHANRGTDRWEIFAWAIRDSMAKAGDFQLCPLKVQEKMEYYKYMMGYTTNDPGKDIEVRKELYEELNKDDQTNTFDHLENKMRASIISRGSNRSAASREKN